MKRTKRQAIEPENRRQIERFALIAYIIHALSIAATLFVAHWDSYVLFPVVLGVPAAIYFYRTEAHSYSIRACVMAVLLWANLVMYALLTDDFVGMFPTIMATIILLALYCVPAVFSISAVCFTALLFWHMLVRRSIDIGLGSGGARVITRVLAVYLAGLIAYYLVKSRLENYRLLLENLDSLRKAERSKDDFMANVSHEIRTPVNTICGMSEIVLQSALPPDARTYLLGIQTAGRNLLSIISNILDFSELQSGSISVVTDTYNITSIVNDIINTANARNSEKGLEIVVDCDPAMPCTMIGDRQKIFRVVTSIMDNAIKFTENGGILLTITARPENYGANLFITVKDTGIGIRPEMQERLFSTFNQADTSRSRAEGGIGLGLAISKATVNKMGGFIHVESVYGEGTQVSIAIPQGVEQATPCISVRHPEDIRILICLRIDKYTYPLIREGYSASIERMTRQFGLNVRTCRSAAEAKQRMENGDITHLFVGWEEYCEDRAYFEAQAETVQTVLILERKYQPELTDSRLLCIYSPFYALSIASVLNGETVQDPFTGIHPNLFVAPEARVLVVDDNMMNLRVVEGLLRPYQIQVVTAQSGREALKKIESRDYDFVFMDHMMPEMDGVETFRRIREKSGEYYRSVPVIALTANAIGSAREMFLNEGFSDYIPKPIEISALEQILRKYIPKSKMRFSGQEIEVRAKAAAPSAAAKAPAQAPGLALEGIDTAAGIGYCGGTVENYVEILRVFCSGSEKMQQDLRDCCARGDWKQYVILTHTLKGTAKSIGANALSELARQREADAKENRTEELAAQTQPLLDEYARVLRVIRANPLAFPPTAAPAAQTPAPTPAAQTPTAPAVPEQAAAPAQTDAPQGETLTAGECAALLDRLAALLQDFDAAAADVIEQQSGKRCGNAALEDVLRPVAERVRDFDFMGAEEALAQARGQLQ